MLNFIIRFYHTWCGIRDVSLGKVPQSGHPIYLGAFSREYIRRVELIGLESFFEQHSGCGK